MRDKKDVTIDNVKYQIYPMSPLKANRVLVRMTKLFGKTIASAILQFLKGKEKGLDTEVKDMAKSLGNLEVMAKAFGEFAVDVDEDKFEEFILILMNNQLVIPNGEKFVNVDQYFGKYGLFHMYKVCWSVLQANYSDFLEGAAESLG